MAKQDQQKKIMTTVKASKENGFFHLWKERCDELLIMGLKIDDVPTVTIFHL